MKPPDIKRILKNYEELLVEAKKTLIFGIPIGELDRDTVLVLWMWSLKAAKEEASHLEKYAELTGELRGRMEEPDLALQDKINKAASTDPSTWKEEDKAFFEEVDRILGKGKDEA